LGAVPALRRQGRRGSLQADPELEAPLNVGDRADRDEAQNGVVRTARHIGARPLPRDDQPVVPQARQGLAHHRPRYLEAARQLGLRGEARILGELPGDDGSEDAVIDPGASLRCRAGGVRLPRTLDHHRRLLRSLFIRPVEHEKPLHLNEKLFLLVSI
jgi:hypothetical protein